MMTTSELKEQLISKVHITEDKDILEFILEFLKQSDIVEPYIFTDEQTARINIALDQSNNGGLISDEEDAKMMNEWLGA